MSARCGGKPKAAGCCAEELQSRHLPTDEGALTLPHAATTHESRSSFGFWAWRQAFGETLGRPLVGISCEARGCISCKLEDTCLHETRKVAWIQCPRATKASGARSGAAGGRRFHVRGCGIETATIARYMVECGVACKRQDGTVYVITLCAFMRDSVQECECNQACDC